MGWIQWQNAATKAKSGSLACHAKPHCQSVLFHRSGREDYLSVLYITVGAENITNTGLSVSLEYINGSSNNLKNWNCIKQTHIPRNHTHSQISA